MLHAMLVHAALLALLALPSLAAPEPKTRHDPLALTLKATPSVSRAPTFPVPAPVTVPFDRRLQVGDVSPLKFDDRG